MATRIVLSFNYFLFRFGCGVWYECELEKFENWLQQSQVQCNQWGSRSLPQATKPYYMQISVIKVYLNW